MADDIRQWLEDLGLGKYGDVFVENEITLRELDDLNDDDLQQLGLPMGPRKRLLRAIGDATANVDQGGSPAEGAQSPAPAAERRQLTVMFCDLVGSTALSRQLDPEDLRDIMRRYQDAVAGAVTRYGGHVAKYLGDGVLAYFGWPQAYEDQAERAVRAGLDAVLAVATVRLADDARLAARVGIATGQVVVGDLIGESGRDAEAVSGETPNLAARLQQVAEPGQVVVGAATRRLVGPIFTLNSLGSQELKGFGDAVLAWSIGDEIESESRFDATHDASLTRFVGRETELQLLLERWQASEGGDGQAVFISGEAGIGKSRLLQGLRDQVAARELIRIRYQCSPYYSNSALYPTIKQLERAAAFRSDDDGETRLGKLDRLLRNSGDEFQANAALIAQLLSLPFEERYGAIELPPQQIKQRLLETLAANLMWLAGRRPILFLFEDIHWIDPTSQELLERIIAGLPRARILLVVTHRPEWQPSFGDHNHLTSIELNRLGRSDGAEIVRAIAGEDVSDEAVERIVSRTDGVPLFIEELTKSLVEGGFDIADADIPATLQASLQARIDRLGAAAKEVAQIGAVIGREFPHDLLVSVAGKSTGDLDAALDRLVQSELVFRTGKPPALRYTFKHALIQDAAYQSLLRRTRQDVHHQVAEVLESRFPEITQSQPELLAHHYMEADQDPKSIPYWYRAGHQAIERSANPEAIAHLSRGRALLGGQPESAESEALELDFCLALGPALMSTRGLAAPEAEAVYLRARQLCQSVDNAASSFQAAWGLWLVYQQRGQIDLAQSATAEVLSLAERQRENVDHLLQAHHAAWTTQLFVGRISECRAHIVEGDALYDIDKHRTHAFSYGGHDPGVCAKTTASEALCLLGYAGQAVQNAVDGVALAEKLSHPFSLAMAHYFVAQVHQYRLEADIVRSNAQATVDMCVAHGFESFRAQAAVLLGWATAAAGESARGIALIHEGLAAWQATGTGMRRPYFLALLADALLRAGRIDEGLGVIAEAEALVESGGETRWQPEMVRLKGALMDCDSHDMAEIEATYRNALAIARGQEARWLELRAAASLARLWQGQGRTDDARDLLSPLHAWYTEGHDTPDLIAARALLDDLE